MNPLALVFFLACSAMIFTVPKKLASIALIVGCCYMTKGQGIELGGAALPIYRMFLLVGLARVISKRESIVGGYNTLDKLMIIWSCWSLFASLFHEWKAGSGPFYTTGSVLDRMLFYFLIRIWLQEMENVILLLKALALLLAPIAFTMCVEKLTGKNIFAVFGGVPTSVAIREGELRAQGPFRHPILAGTVGGGCVPLFISIYRYGKARALLGLAASVGMVFACASSGPILTVISGLFGVALWNFKPLVKKLRITAVVAYIITDIVSTVPPYFLITKLNIIGGSTAWHRAFLMQQTGKHFSEWWLFGTDRTRHWMPAQGAISPEHTDITNYYIAFGVSGGLAGMLLILGMFWLACKWTGLIVDKIQATEPENAFVVWCLGCSLFAHALSGLSVAYFDQSMVFIWLTIAAISSAYSRAFAKIPGSDPVEGSTHISQPA